jgi:membrane-associated phospholipid phosphatase
MLEWTCYSEFGCPSGHAMLGLLLLEFIVRFFIREYKGARKFSWLLYIIVVIFELLVMFSRVILGMHSFNEVIMGAMMGMYCIAIYYLYVEAYILRYFECLLQ